MKGADAANRGMGRRRFLKEAARATLFGGLFLTLGCKLESLRRTSSFEIAEATIDSIHSAIRSGQLTALELVELHPAIVHRARDVGRRSRRRSRLGGIVFYA